MPNYASDAGYQGIQDDLPNHSVITPFKNTKNNPLNHEQKALNREFSSGRIIVENTICQLSMATNNGLGPNGF